LGTLLKGRGHVVAPDFVGMLAAGDKYGTPA